MVRGLEEEDERRCEMLGWLKQRVKQGIERGRRKAGSWITNIKNTVSHIKPSKAGPVVDDAWRERQPPLWQRDLVGILQARHCDLELPDDLDSALLEAASRLRSVGRGLVKKAMGELVDQVRLASSSGAMTTLSERLERVRTRLSEILEEWRKEWDKEVIEMNSSAPRDLVGDKILRQIRQDAEKVSAVKDDLERLRGLRGEPFQWNTFAGTEVALGAFQEVLNLMKALESPGDPQKRADALLEAFNC